MVERVVPHYFIDHDLPPNLKDRVLYYIAF